MPLTRLTPMTATRVFLLNNYDIRDAFERVDAGDLPSQHLWGAWESRERLSWQVPPRNWVAPRGRLGALRRRLLPFTGDLAQQWHVLRRARRGDVVYAADQQSAALLAALRRLRLLRVPVIVMVHNGPRSAWTRWWMRGADALLALGTEIGARHELALRAPVQVMPWGPGLDSPVYAVDEPVDGTPLDVVAAGKTNRDYGSLIDAIGRARLRAVIAGPDGVDHYADGSFVRRTPAAGYPELVAAMRRARWVAIPLEDPSRLSGLTEAADALALGVPMVVTRSVLFPYVGDGVVVTAPHDAQALAETIAAEAPAPPATLAATWNMDRFADELVATVARLAAS